MTINPALRKFFYGETISDFRNLYFDHSSFITLSNENSWFRYNSYIIQPLFHGFINENVVGLSVRPQTGIQNFRKHPGNTYCRGRDLRTRRVVLRPDVGEPVVPLPNYRYRPLSDSDVLESQDRRRLRPDGCVSRKRPTSSFLVRGNLLVRQGTRVRVHDIGHTSPSSLVGSDGKNRS